MDEHPPAAPVRVLIADDDTGIRRRLIRCVEDVGNTVVVGDVGDGESALRAFDDLEPHVVVLDITMPKLSGIAVLQGIRRREGSSVVIMLSSHDEPSIRSHCLVEGADHFLPKSAGLDALAEILAACSIRLPCSPR